MQNMQQPIIQIEIEFLGQLSSLYRNIKLEIAEKSKIHEIIPILNISNIHIRSILVIKNDTISNPNEQLEHNDKLFITLPLGGG